MLEWKYGDIRTDPREMGWKNVDWMHLLRDRDHWQDLVNTVMKTQDVIRSGEFLD
jgi:hypothetical protein